MEAMAALAPTAVPEAAAVLVDPQTEVAIQTRMQFSIQQRITQQHQ
jgi:hypothetical protein